MFKFVLALRYLFKKRISYLALAAVALCVFIVVVVMTVMNGLVSDFKQKNHSYVGDCVVRSTSLVGFAYYGEFTDLLRKQAYVQAVSPVVQSYALVTREGSQQGRGVQIVGVDGEAHSRATNFASTLHYRENEPQKVFEPMYDPNLAGCVFGIDLALRPDERGHYLFSSIPVKTSYVINCFPLNPRGALAKAGAGLVNAKTFYFSDVSKSGLARVDSSTIYIPLQQAQLLCGMKSPVERISRLHIKFGPGVEVEQGCSDIRQIWRDFTAKRADLRYSNLLSRVRVQSWKSYKRPLIAAMEKEQTLMIIMFSLVGLTTVFIIFVVFYMIVSHKTKDIGILKSLGASGQDLIMLYLGFAFLVGVIGSAVGIAGGCIFLKNINNIENWMYQNFQFQLWDRTIYAIGEIPNQVTTELLCIVGICSIIACLAGAVIPTFQAARLNPVETLQVTQI